MIQEPELFAPTESFETALPATPPQHLPHSSECEAALLGACLLDSGSTADLAISSGVTDSSFYFEGHRIVFEAIRKLRATNTPLDNPAFLLSTIGPKMEQIGGPKFLLTLAAVAPTTAYASHNIAEVLDLANRRRVISGATRTAERAKDRTTPISDTATAAVADLSAVQASSSGSLRERMAPRRFSQARQIPEAIPRILINDRGVCTPGNLTTVIAQSKAGKSAYIGAIISAIMVSDLTIPDRDTLGITASAPHGGVLIHLDTEQSIYDHDQLIRLSLRRAGADDVPSWLLSYALAGFSAADLNAALKEILRIRHPNGIYGIILDGSADFVSDVNDPGECNGFVASLHGLAIEHACPIINVVHENPGQDFGKMRGHLGSQLERKAESNLRLRKQDEVTVVFSEKMRKAPILEKDGPRFSWSVQDSMHMSVRPITEVRNDEKLSDLRDLAEEIFGEGRLRYADACRKIETARRVGEKSSEKWFSIMKKHNVIDRQTMGFWDLKR